MGKGVGALKKGGGCDLLQVDSTTTEFLKKRKKKLKFLEHLFL